MTTSIGFGVYADAAPAHVGRGGGGMFGVRRGGLGAAALLDPAHAGQHPRDRQRESDTYGD